MKLDDLDIEIMKILQVDGRKSFREISDILDKPESTIRARYNQLIKNNVLRIVAIPDPESVGLNIMAIIGLKVKLKHLQEAAEKVAQFSEVRFIAFSSGIHDLILEVYVESNDHLVEFLAEKLSKIDGITESNTSIELKLYKDSYDWLAHR